MWDLDNRTPFPALQAFDRDKDGRPSWNVWVKATFAFRHGRSCRFVQDQKPLATAPIYREGRHAGRELLADVDVCAPKLRTDILLSGTARAPADAATVVAGLSLGGWAKQIEVHPERSWVARKAQPHDAPERGPVDLGYANAYGGPAPDTDEGAERQVYPDNPLGLGYCLSQPPDGAVPLARLTYPGERQTTWDAPIRPAAFGPIPRDWPARLRFAGTYDEGWRSRKAPLLPDDFDPLFLQAAPPDQQAPDRIEGGEAVLLSQVVTPEADRDDGDVAFTLPRLRFECITRYKGAWRELSMDLQTVHVLAADGLVTLSFCASLPFTSVASDVEIGESRLRLQFEESGHFNVATADLDAFGL